MKHHLNFHTQQVMAFLQIAGMIIYYHPHPCTELLKINELIYRSN